ncbi:hypothetical protein FJTKL_10346 [Diaporthe vaccinii]|uniref:Uncharacterized protein n=1 Tax=Diaporthe vaccinii TaxID=105482 RepID=A0ABR4EJU0_9PEZI
MTKVSLPTGHDVAALWDNCSILVGRLILCPSCATNKAQRPVILFERPCPYPPEVSVCFILLCFVFDLVILTLSLISIISSIVRTPRVPF